MKNRMFRFFHRKASLDERIYLSILSVGVVVSLIALVMAAIQHLGAHACFSTFAFTCWFILMQYIGFRWRNVTSIPRLVLVMGLNFILFPTVYFTFGGMDSGMTLFYLLGLFNVAILLRGGVRVVAFLLSLAVMMYSMHISHIYPELLSSLTAEQQYQDRKLALFLTGTTLVILTSFILKAYEMERAQNAALMERLTDLSIRDALSGLYNRRELFRRLELVFQTPEESGERPKRENCHIAMFDIDNFKRLNDTYGHSFGDTVLSAVARKCGDGMNQDMEEFAARYGGEEFVCVLYSDSFEQAFGRVDAVRREISGLVWEEAPGLSVTVSGGLISCGAYDGLDGAMRDVDMLLYQAKKTGKNRIADCLSET